MLRRRLNFLNFSVRLVTLLLPSFSFAISGYLRFVSGLIPRTRGGIVVADYFTLLVSTTLIWALVVDHYGLTRLDLAFVPGYSARKALKACVVTYVIMMGATFFYRSASFSRVFVALSAIVLFVLVVLAGKAFRAILVNLRQKGKTRARVLMVGTDDFAHRAARSMLERLVMPCTVVGFIQLPGQEIAVQGAPVVDLNIRSVRAVCGTVDDIVIAIPPARFEDLPRIIAELEPLSVPVRAILDFGRGVVFREALFDFEGIPMVDLRMTPSESVMYMLAKRGFDVIFATLAIIVSAPLMGLLAIATRLTSPGPVLFAQDRVGLNGRVFRMYKFRTMTVSHPAESDTRWTTPDDSRRTSFGAFLRWANLDELPQFFNVLIGDMSVVGPRPERPYFVEKFVRNVAQYNTRHYLKVGITGWAQVNGWRGDTSIARRVEHDLYYLRNWSLSFDLKIIFMTVWRTIVANKNAY